MPVSVPPYGRLGENILGIKFALCCIMCKSIKNIYNDVMSTNDGIYRRSSESFGSKCAICVQIDINVRVARTPVAETINQ